MNKHIILSLLIISAVAHTPNSTVHASTYSYYSSSTSSLSRVEEAAASYLRQNSPYTVSTLPWQYKSEYEQGIKTAYDELIFLYDSTFPSYALDYQIALALKPLCKKLQKIGVQQENIDDTVAKAVRAKLVREGLSEETLPAIMVSDYFAKVQTILVRIRNIMSVNGQSSPRTYDVERVVNEELASFIKRVKDYQQSSYNSYSYTTPKPPTAPAPSYDDAQKVYRSNLETKVNDIVAKRFAANNLNSDKVPARATNLYYTQKQKVIDGLMSMMNSYHRDYVTIVEIELRVRQEMQSVIDLINLVGESCSICLDSYSTGQRTGELNCGHVYHKDCIYTWLKTSRTCPLCRKENVIVAKQEIVP